MDHQDRGAYVIVAIVVTWATRAVYRLCQVLQELYVRDQNNLLAPQWNLSWIKPTEQGIVESAGAAGARGVGGAPKRPPWGGRNAPPQTSEPS